MKTLFHRRLFGDSRAAVSIEYALLGLFLGVALVAALKSTKSGLQQNYDSISYNMSQTAGSVQQTVAKVYAASLLTENGIQYMQSSIKYNAPGTNACPCNFVFTRVPVDLKNGPYQQAVFTTDSTAALNIIGVTTTNNDGSVSYDQRTPLYPGVTIVAHQDSSGTYTYRETATTAANNFSAVTRTFMSGSGQPWQSYQYVVDQTVAGVSTTIGTIQTNADGSVIKTGQDITSYY